MTAANGSRPHWPQAPDAQILLPASGSIELPDALASTGVSAQQLTATWCIGTDRITLTALRDGIPIAYPSPRRVPLNRISDLYPPRGIAISDIVGVAAGVLSGLDKPTHHSLPSTAKYLIDYYWVTNGPAVLLLWGADAQELIISTNRPQELAAEIERRRQRVMWYGGFKLAFGVQAAAQRAGAQPVAPQPWGGFGPPYGREVSQPKFKNLIEFFDNPRWQPLELPPVPRWAAGIGRTTSPTPAASVPYPETVPPKSVALHGDQTPLSLTITNRRLALGPQPLPPTEPVYAEQLPPEPHPFLTVPLARWSSVQAGNLSGVPAGWTDAVFAPDARTRIGFELVDGPALWLWGPFDEWLIPTPDAAALAAEIEHRRTIGMLYPVTVYDGPERGTWLSFPELKPVDGPQGRALAPLLPSTPTQPTMVPLGTWTATD